MIVGEATGERTELLLELLSEQRFTRSNCFITHAVSCRPPDRTPTKGEIRACNRWLQHQLNVVKPRFVLLLGNVALQSITGKAGIKSKRGRPFERDGVIYLPTFHPASVFHEPDNEGLILKDIILLRTIVDAGEIPRERDLNVVIVDDVSKFRDLKRALRRGGAVSLDIETTSDDKDLGGLYPWARGARINTIGFGTRDTQYILPVSHPESPWLKKWDVLCTMVTELMGLLRECFIIAHNGKFDFLWIWVIFGIFVSTDFDTMLAHYILDENDRHDLKYLAQKFCGAPDWDIDKDKKQEGTLAEISLYQAHDLFYTRKLRFVFGPMLRKDGGVKRVFDEILMPCSALFTEIEYDGVCIDITKMGDAEKYLRGELHRTEKNMSRWAAVYKKKFGKDINWGSTKQLAWLLYTPKREGGLGIVCPQKTKKGNNSTSESTLNQIDHPMVGDLIAFRGAKQQLSFFIDGWKPYLVQHEDGSWRIHPSFKLHGTVTGRLSCEHPNLQQVPRDPRIRSLIIAPPGWDHIEADLSQIELRIAAELAGERNMLDAFLKGIDVHWKTALRELERGGGGDHADTIMRTAKAYAKEKKLRVDKIQFSDAIQLLLEMGPSKAEEIQQGWNETDPKKVWKEVRKKAKAVNFGYLYGMWWKKFKIYARDNYGVHVSDEEAEASRESFFELYPDFETWHKDQRRYARMNGYVRSLSQRKRRLPDAQDHHDTPFRREAERQAINSPVQSFANEINLMAALQLRREFGRDVVRLTGTVHDSILGWTRQSHTKRVVTRVLEIMKRPALFDKFDINLTVPVEAEAKIGPWGISKDFHKWVATSSKSIKAKLRNGASAN